MKLYEISIKKETLAVAKASWRSAFGGFNNYTPKDAKCKALVSNLSDCAESGM